MGSGLFKEQLSKIVEVFAYFWESAIYASNTPHRLLSGWIYSVSTEDYTDDIGGHMNTEQTYYMVGLSQVRRCLYLDDILLEEFVEIGNILNSRGLFLTERRWNFNGILLSILDLLDVTRQGYHIRLSSNSPGARLTSQSKKICIHYIPNLT